MSRKYPSLLLGHSSQGLDVRIPQHERMYHTYIVGGSRSGKSKLLEYLIRQDIKNWKDTRNGMLVIDPHGSLYDNIISWLAAAKACRPIVPIDLRQTDTVCGYNLLRHRDCFEPSVVISQIVDTMAYAWGAPGTDATPQFSRWMHLILGTLYHLEMRFPDALRMITDSTFRRKCIERISAPSLREMWKTTEHLKPEAFLDQVNSSLNRLPRFLENENLRMCFAQNVSFDFKQAIEEGQIVLVCLGEEKGQISRSDGRTLGTLLLSDLWTAVKQIGKPSDASRIKPFFVYLDEFQMTITPTIAENLEQARGYGLWMTLAHQAPSQLKREGRVGEGIFRSILTNTGNKLVFRSDDPQDLDDLAGAMYLGSIDFDKEKFRIESTKVIDYATDYMESSTEGTSSAVSKSISEGMREEPDDENDEEREVAGWNEAESDATSDSSSKSTTSTQTLVPILGKEVSNIVLEGIDEQLWRAKQSLFGQQQRRGIAKLIGTTQPIAFESVEVTMPHIRRSTVDLYAEIQRSQWPFFVSREEAKKQLYTICGDAERNFEKSSAAYSRIAESSDDEGVIWRRIK